MRTIERLKLFIDHKRLALSGFDKLIGMANGYTGKMIKTSASIGSDVIERIISIFPEINGLWLISGEGEMLKTVNYLHLPQPESQYASEPEPGYVQLPHTPQSHISNKNVSPTVSPTPNFEAKSIYLTPRFITVDNHGNENILHISARAAAGYLSGYNNPQYLQQQPTFRLPGLEDATYRSFQVDGHSMEPTLKDKELVIGKWVEKIDYIRDDRVHILVTKNDGVIIKRLLNRVDKYNKIIAKSDATNDRELYPNIEVAPEDILEIWYAVFHGGFSFQSPTDMWRRVNNHEADLTILRNQVDKLLQANNPPPNSP